MKTITLTPQQVQVLKKFLEKGQITMKDFAILEIQHLKDIKRKLTK